MNNNINLIGYRCCGKSLVGKKLADILQCPFVDADLEFSKHTMVSISDYVANFGWPEFRRQESQILSNLCQQENIVLATGGGVVLSPENRLILKESGVNFWLQANLETILERMTADAKSASQRPALSALGLADEISAGLNEREPFYREVAGYSIVVDSLSPDEIAEKIISFYKDDSRRVE